MKGILLDENGDIMVRNGSVVIGDVDAQVTEHVLTAFQGEYKEVPLLGGGAAKMLNGKPDPFWTAEMKRQLKTQYVNADIAIMGNGDFVVKLK